MNKCSMDDLNQAAEELQSAARGFVHKVMGEDVAGHLREALRHTLKAAKSAIHEAESALDKGCDSHQECESTTAHDAEAPNNPT